MIIAMNNDITMCFSINCPTVICSPTIEYLCSFEKPLVKPMAPGSILIISISITLIMLCFITLPLLFTLHLYHKNTKNITLSQNYLLPIISVFAENTLLKTACHFLLLLVGCDTLTYRKDYDRSPILVGHQDSFLAPLPGSDAPLVSGIW